LRARLCQTSARTVRKTRVTRTEELTDSFSAILNVEEWGRREGEGMGRMHGLYLQCDARRNRRGIAKKYVKGTLSRDQLARTSTVCASIDEHSLRLRDGRNEREMRSLPLDSETRKRRESPSRSV